MSRMRTIAAAILVLVAAGCGNDKGSNPIVTPVPENSTPAGTLARFERVYETRSLAAYAALFTSDFSFRFSAEADPLLVAYYGTSWGIDDEVISAEHLFNGFTQADPPNETFGPATSIAMSLIGPQIVADSTHADSTAHYKRAIVPVVDLSVTAVISSFETVFEVSARHDLYLVRGDAAVLDGGQPSDSLHWYIRRWDDMTPALPALLPIDSAGRGGQLAPGQVASARPASWGVLKHFYRR